LLDIVDTIVLYDDVQPIAGNRVAVFVNIVARKSRLQRLLFSLDLMSLLHRDANSEYYHSNGWAVLPFFVRKARDAFQVFLCLYLNKL